MEISTILMSLPLGVTFVVTGLFINLIQAALYLTIRPISKNTFRKINGAIAEILWLQILCLMEWWAGIEVKLYTDLKTYHLMGKEHAVLMSNHISDMDTYILWILAQRSGCLRSALTVVKKSSKYLPIVGWASWFFGFVFLERSWAKDEGYLKTSLEELKDFPMPFWLTIFVEGTRLTPDKLLASQEFAISKGLLIQENVLIPRTKGFIATIQCLRSFVSTIYDVTIVVPKTHPIPSLLRTLRRQPWVVKVHITRYSFNELSESENEIAKWCKDKFIFKDVTLKKFFNTGTFDDPEIKNYERSIKSLIVVISCSCVVTLGGWILCHKFGKGHVFLGAILAIVAVTIHIFIEYTKLPQQIREI